MSEKTTDFFKRTGLTAAKAFLGLYMFGAGVMILVLLLMLFFDESVGLDGEIGQYVQDHSTYLLVGCLLSGVGAYFGYVRIPDFVDLISPADED
jgi:hypothetical protein